MFATPTRQPPRQLCSCPALPATAAAGRPAEPLIEQATRFIQAVVEIVAGDRPCTQVIRYADERVYATLTRHLVAATRDEDGRGVRQRPRGRVVSIRVTCPRSNVAEVSARVSDGTRSRALAARLEQMRGRWVCTALEIG
ncbi:MAG: Rv3235 family protein [Actinomycetota bacterium]|nr:Rv3235 family protein [Actinomycetota bacterium]